MIIFLLLLFLLFLLFFLFFRLVCSARLTGDFEIVSIKTQDGEVLSGLLYAAHKRASATVLRIDPYREQTYNWERNRDLGHFLQRHGYNYLAIDVRGTGQSTGIATDEYSEQEEMDHLAILRFIVEQPWSNGQIIPYGISYSGFTALQFSLTAAKHNHLNNNTNVVAAFVMHASDDRWKTDVHWWGGVKTVTDWLQYATAMSSYNLLPRLNGKSATNERWKTNKPWVLNWVTKKPAYWKQGSIGEEAAKITIPVFLYGGFHDLYVDAMVRLSETLPRNLLVVSQQGHELPPNHDELLLWWLTNYTKTNTRQDAYYFIRDRWLHIIKRKGNSNNKVVKKWRHGGIVSLQRIYGPLFRYREQSILPLKAQLDAHGLRFAFSLTAMVVIGAPIVEIQVRNPPADFYLVAWLLDENGKVESIGTNRFGGEEGTRKTIVMAPVGIKLEKSGCCYYLYLTTSNLPNLIPQFWLRRSIVVDSCQLTFQIASYDFNQAAVPLPNQSSYVDQDLGGKTRFAKESLVLTTKSIECQEPKNRLPIGAPDYECEDETMNIGVTKDHLDAEFYDQSKMYTKRKHGEELSILSITRLHAEGKKGMLSVSSYALPQQTLISCFKEDFPL